MPQSPSRGQFIAPAASRPRRVEFDGQIHEFPPGTSDAEIEQALEALSPKPPMSAASKLISNQIQGGIGFAKRAADTALTLGKMFVAGTPGANPVAAMQELGPNPQALQPVSTAGRVGGAGFDVLSAAVPLSRGSQAIKTATQVLPRAAQLPARMVGEAALNTGVAKVQGGDPAIAGAVGAAIPVVGQIASKLSPVLRAAAEKKVAQALGATKERFKAIVAKRAPEILQRGLRGSREKLLSEATENAREAGKAVDAVLTAKGTQMVPVQPVIDALEQAKAGFQVTRQIPMAEAVRTGAANQPGATVIGNMVEVPIALDARPLEQLTQLQTILRQLGDDATVEQVIAARRAWDTVVAQAGGYAHRAGGTFGVPLREQTEAWAKKQATTAMRNVLSQEVPDLAAVNREFAFWKDVKDVLASTKGRTQAQTGTLTKVISATTGAVVGGAAGGGGGALTGTLLAPEIVKALRSTQWRLIDASARQAMADALASGNTARMAAMATRLAAISASKIKRPETGGRQ